MIDSMLKTTGDNLRFFKELQWALFISTTLYLE